MSEVFFFDQDGAARPREQVRIEQARAEPYPDGRRVRVTVVLTPFVERPNLSITISDSSGVTVAEADVLEPVTPTTELTMHLRPPASRRKHILRVELYYGHDEPQDVLRLSFLPKSES